MKKTILSALFALVFCYSSAQDDVYGTPKQKKSTSSDLKKSMQIDYDKFENISRVSHKPLLGNSSFRLNCSFIIRSDKPEELRFKVIYFGKDWLFVHGLTFLIDGKKYSLDVEPHRIVDGGYAVEEVGLPVEGVVKEIVEAIMLTDKVEFRYSGKDHFKDEKNLSMDIKRLRRVVEYYKTLGGTI